MIPELDELSRTVSLVSLLGEEVKEDLHWMIDILH